MNENTETHELKRQLVDLTALREADQATIASLELVNKELADALEATVAHVAVNAFKRDNAWHEAGQQLLEQAKAALRSAGRLPAQKGESDV